MLVLSAALLGAACLAAHAASSRPYELLIYRKGKTCNLATLKKAQEYRGNVAYGHPGRTDLGGGEDRLRVVFEAREHAWVHLEMACGPRDSWEFPVLTDTAPLPLTGSQVRTELGASAEQDVLALPEPARGLFPLEFELEPLVKSGHSSNRVDLIFFADGCTYCSDVTQSGQKLTMSSNIVQTQGMSETNSLKMPTVWQRISPATRRFTRSSLC